MEPKPKVAPRSSLRKTGFENVGNSTANSKPILPLKPTFPVNSVVSNPVNENPFGTKNRKPSHLNESTNVKICNKLKINASDLNKLRFRNDLFENKNVDSKGNMIYDVREDEEQIAKMKDISQLLVAGGYFRARIKGLHNFDKIIGGICWAIQMCNVDLDVDIFYKETLSIGQKLALTEKIVRVLQKMKCPFKLEPHQIQGLDCIHIFPVIQWLVKKSFETRQQTSEYIRVYAAWQFNRCYNQKEACTDSVILTDWELANQLMYPIKAQLRRRFVHPTREKLQGEDVRTKTTLLEYGVLGTGSSQNLVSQFNTAGSRRQLDNSDTVNPLNGLQLNQQKSRSESDSQTVENLLNSMTETDESTTGNFIKGASSLVGSILSGQSDEIKRIAEDYAKKNNSTNSLDFLYMKKDAKLKNEITLRKNELEKQSQSNIDERLFSIKEKLEAIDAKLRKTEETEKTESEEVKAEKIQLTEMLGILRKQKSELKHHCREEKQRLEVQLETLNQKNVVQINTPDKAKEVDAELQVYKDRYDSIKKELSDVSKHLATIKRKFDDVPTRTELSQYQKRLLELFQNLSNKHNETKKFYTLYNILSEERSYLEKELNLINSILDNFKTAYVSSAMIKDEFAVKFEQIVESIIQNKDKVETRLAVEKKKRDQLNLEYIDLVEQQRLYFKAVKEFKQECKNNEELIAQLGSRPT